ncbi:MAG: ABC transporter permease subunit, partial [Brachybacterium tyrofermentans]
MIRFVSLRVLTYAILAFVATSFAYLLAASLMHPEEVLYPPIATEPLPPATAQMYLDVRNVNPDTPLFERYATWLGGLVRGDLGVTTGTNKSMTPVIDELGTRIPISLRLVVLGTVIGTSLGIVLGMIAAVRRDSLGDRASTLLAFFVLSLPTPVIILIVQQINQGVMDTTGWGLPAINPINPLLEPGSWESFTYQVKALIMPTIVLALTAAASYSRYMKVTTLDVL